MPVDGRPEKPDDREVPRICAAIRHAVDEDPRSMRTIAKDAEDFTYQQLQKWASGEEPRLDNLRRIEVALDPERMAGWLLRAAGYVDDPTSLEEAIEADPRLEATDVRALKIALRMHLGEEQP